jgi:membrane protein
MNELRQVTPKPVGRRSFLHGIASSTGKTRSWRLIWRVLTDIPNLDAAGLAAEIAYRSFAAILPSLVFSAAVFALIAPLFGGPNVRLHVEESIVENLPPSAASFVLPYITSIFQGSRAPALSLGLVLSLWTISSVITTVMKAAGRILHMPEHRSFAHRHLVALVLSAYLPVLLASSLALTWFGQRLQTAAHQELLGLDLPARALQLGGSFLLGCCAIWILFRVAAPRRLPRLPMLAGTLFTLGGFWIASQLFALYAAAFAHYHSAYGVLGGTLALLVWLYVSAFVLLGGLELIALLIGRRA